MKIFFASFLHGSEKESDRRVVKTALNRDRIIKFSHMLREVNSIEIISDYSVEDEDLANQSGGPPATAAD